MSRQNDLSQRIAASSVEAATGYATAAVAAYVDLTGQMLGMWAQAVDTMMGGAAQPKSWYRHPDQPRAGAAAPFNPFAFAPWTLAAAGSGQSFGSTGAASLPAFNPFAVWMNAWPLQGNPVAWPMAFAMMGMGVSRSVAYPLAQANMAAMDAVKAAGDAVEEGFSSYRSDGGHASAQVRIQSGPTMAALMPLGLGAFVPFMTALSSFPRTL